MGSVDQSKLGCKPEMTILEKLKEKKEQKEVIKTVEKAKLTKARPQIEKELEKKTEELVEELGVTFDEALIYVKNEKKKKHQSKITQKRQERFGAKGKKILRGLEDWGARANQPPKPQPHETETTTETKIQEEVKKKPIPTKRKKPKNFFEICKEANR